MSLSVSVAMCTFNGARFIDEQLRSIFAQTLKPSEIVVADDGSSDETLDRVRAALAETEIPAVVLTGNSPLGVTRNFQRAVEACSSDLVALSDQDDIWHPDRLAASVPAFGIDPGLLLQHSDARLVDETGAPLGLGLLTALSVSASERHQLTSGAGGFDVYLRRNLVTGATVLFRRQLRDSALPFPVEWVHDEWLALIAGAIGSTLLHDSELIDYRQHGNNEIGVAKPTLAYRVGRMFAPRGSRYVDLAARARVLVARLEELGVDPAKVDRAREKARFEAVRASLPTRRLSRLGPVLQEYRRGSYRALSSQGNLDVVRDLVQPA